MKKIAYTLTILIFSMVSLYPRNDSIKVVTLNNKDTIYVVLDSSFADHSNHKSESNWFELSIPFFVAIIGGLIAIYQVRINIIKSARINWIENLRHNISFFISSTENVRHNLDLMMSDINAGTDADEAFSNHSKELIAAFNESIMSATKVRLYLNMKEKLHGELNEKIGDFIEISSNSFDVRDRNKVKEDILSLINDVILLSQKILKKEWDRVSKTWFKRFYQKISKTA